MSHVRLAPLLASGGVVCAVALLPAAFFAPFYHGESVSPNGTVATLPSQTFVGVNGLWVVWLLCIPVVLALTAWLGLHFRCSRASALGSSAAWAAVALLLVFAVVGSASIGLFVLPTALMLLAAAALTPRRTAATSSS